MAKEFLTAHNTPFQDIDVSQNMEARRYMVDVTGQMGVPVIEIKEEGQEPMIMVGFNEKLLAETVGIA
jgi:glutaredoxin